MRYLLPLVPLLFTLSACESESRFIPYVPGPGFDQRMAITLELPDSAPVGVGQWVTMHATRQSGPWVLRDSAATDEPRCEEISPITQDEAAGKVEWRVEPEGQVNFSPPGPPDRQIRFLQPGTYRVWAVSKGCGAPIQSNVVDVTVR